MARPIGRRALIVVENCYLLRDTRVLAEALTLKKDGWDVTVICPAADPESGGERGVLGVPAPYEIEGITVYAFPLDPAERGVVGYLREYALASWYITRCMARAWRRAPMDTVQFCNPPDTLFPLAFLSRLLGAAVIFDHHDLFPEVVRWRFEGWVGGVLHALAVVAEYLTFRSASIVISTNRSYERIAVTRGRVPPERIYIVRNGPRLQQFTPMSPVPALKQGFPYMACYVGMMGQQDGVLELIDVIRDVVHHRGRTDVLFVLLGDGAVRREALARVRAWGLEGVVYAPGMVSDSQLLRQYLCTADVCLAPELSSPLNARSTFIKVGEYMAMGKPVLAYDLAETRYTAADAAVYVAPGDVAGYGQALLDLLARPEERARMGCIGRERMSNQLSWEHQQPMLLLAYRAALQRSRRFRRETRASAALGPKTARGRRRTPVGNDRQR